MNYLTNLRMHLNPSTSPREAWLIFFEYIKHSPRLLSLPLPTFPSAEPLPPVEEGVSELLSADDSGVARVGGPEGGQDLHRHRSPVPARRPPAPVLVHYIQEVWEAHHAPCSGVGVNSVRRLISSKWELNLSFTSIVFSLEINLIALRFQNFSLLSEEEAKSKFQ